MKRAFFLFSILNILIMISWCSNKFYYDLDTLQKEVVYADVVEPYWDVDRFNFKIVNQVDDSKLDEVLSGLTKFEFISYRGGPKSPKGFALKLNYIDGYEVIYDTRIVWFNNNDEFIKQEFILRLDAYNEFLSKYT